MLMMILTFCGWLIEKHREQKANTEQGQSHLQNNASSSLDNKSPVASNTLPPLTSPSTMCTSRSQSLIGCDEDVRGDGVIDYDFLLDTSDQCGMNEHAEVFWTSTLKDADLFHSTALILPPDPKDYGVHHTTLNSGDSEVQSENSGAAAGPTMLHRAVQTGNSKVVALLLEHNADCNSKDDVGLTPLSCAVIAGHEDIIELLLSHGASIRHLDDAHWSALHWAVFHNHHRILERLLRNCGRDPSLLNIRNKKGDTPLSVAVGAGSEVAVKLLLEFGATVM
jgi:hypothetical protein